MLTRSEAKQLIARILSHSRTKDCQVTVGERDLAQTRCANNTITTSGRSLGIAVTISSTRDRRTGTVVTGDTSDDALRRAVAQSEELARLSPVDPEYVEPSGVEHYPDI